MSRAAALLAVALAGSPILPARAADIGAGRRLAERQCSGCHALETPGHPGETGPSFADVAQMPSATALSLHAFLLTPHPHMPNYRLSAEEVDDVVAYILSLRRR